MCVCFSVGLNGTVSIRPLEGPKAGIVPTWQSAKSPESYTVLDVDQNAYLFVGGMLGSVKVHTNTLHTLHTLQRKDRNSWKESMERREEEKSECKGSDEIRQDKTGKDVRGSEWKVPEAKEGREIEREEKEM